MEQAYKERIFSSNLFGVEIISVLLIIGAFFSSNVLMLASALLLSAYILGKRDDTLCIALFFFVLPFSQIFNTGGSSFFIFLKFAFILKYLYKTTKVEKKYICVVFIFITYSVFGMLLNGTLFSGYMRLINLVLWFVTIYIMSTVSSERTFFYAGMHFLMGLILSCFVAFFSDYIPGLNEMLSAATINQSVARFSGLWNDPNTFSVFMGVGLTIVFLFYSKKLINAIVFYVFAGILSVFALMSLSKMCLFIVLIVWLGMLVSNKKISILQKVFILIVFGLICACIWYFFPNIITTYLWRFHLDSTNSYSLDSLTTHRSELWKIYISELNSRPFSWIIGNGMGCELPIGRAAHQSILQIVFNSGILGILILIEMMYVSCKPLNYMLDSSYNRDSKMMFISLFPILIILIGIMFLDYYFIEYIYFLVFLAIQIRKGVCYL